MIRHAILDWNGTLLADATIVCQADSEVMCRYGGQPIDLATYRELHVIPAKLFYAARGCDMERLEAVEELASYFHSVYEPLAARARTRIGCRQLLRDLQAAGIERVILTNHSEIGIQSQLQRLKLQHLVSRVLANQPADSFLQKNKGIRLQSYLAEQSAEPRETVIVGDTIEEIEIGHEAGIWTIALTGGFNSTRRLVAARPDFLVDSLVQVNRVIAELSAGLDLGSRQSGGTT